MTLLLVLLKISWNGHCCQDHQQFHDLKFSFIITTLLLKSKNKDIFTLEFLKDKLYWYFCVGVSLCACVDRYLKRPKKGVGSPLAVVIDSFELSKDGYL